MRAVVYKEPCHVAVENVDDARIEMPGDAIVKITSTAICGSDLHMYEGRTGANKNFDARGSEYIKIILRPGMAAAA